jgi:hypothetical protein
MGAMGTDLQMSPQQKGDCDCDGDDCDGDRSSEVTLRVHASDHDVGFWKRSDGDRSSDVTSAKSGEVGAMGTDLQRSPETAGKAGTSDGDRSSDVTSEGDRWDRSSDVASAKATQAKPKEAAMGSCV